MGPPPSCPSCCWGPLWPTHLTTHSGPDSTTSPAGGCSTGAVRVWVLPVLFLASRAPGGRGGGGGGGGLGPVRAIDLAGGGGGGGAAAGASAAGVVVAAAAGLLRAGAEVRSPSKDAL